MERTIEFILSHWQGGVFDASKNYDDFCRKKRYRSHRILWWSLSSAAAVAAAVVFVFFLRYNAVREYSAGSRMAVVTLKDGTSARLAPGAVLRTRPRKNPRTVELEGKVLFEVSKDPEHPFVAKAGNAAVKVLGTVFQIDAGSLQTRVDVTEGKVLFFTGGEEIVLVAGESAETADGGIVRTESMPNPLAWARNVFIYKAETLETVLKELSAYYDCELALEDQAEASRKISGTFPADSLAEVIDLIEAAMDIKIVSR